MHRTRASLAITRSQDAIEARESGWKDIGCAACLIALCAIAYCRVHSFAFFSTDDGAYVFANPHVTGPLNWSAVKWAFTHVYMLNYDPLTFLAHSIDVRLFQTNPGGHHVMNLLLHALNVLLLFWVLKRVTGYSGRSFMVAALFAVHPVNVENVAWVAELKTLLSTAFFLLALGAYGWYARRISNSRMLLVAILYGAALLAKPQAITFPFVLLLWDYWPLRRFGAGIASDKAGPAAFWELVKEKEPLFIIAAADAIITSLAEHKDNQPYTLLLRAGNAIVSYVKYIWKAFWPVHLAYFYPHPGYSLRWLHVWICLAVLIAVTVLTLKFRKMRYLPVGWFWFLGTLFPMIGLIQIDAPAMADRYAYISYIGLFIIVCWAVGEWSHAHQILRPMVPAISAATLVVLTFLTYVQAGYWKDSATMWAHSAQVTRNNWFAEGVLAALLQEEGKDDLALRHWLAAVQENPGDSSLALRAASLEQKRGMYQDAIYHYRMVLAATQDEHIKAQVWANMGHAYGALGDVVQEQTCYRNAELIRLSVR